MFLYNNIGPAGKSALCGYELILFLIINCSIESLKEFYMRIFVLKPN